MSIFQFPNQRIPETKKDINWHKQHIINYVNYSATPHYNERKQDMLECYYAANAQLSPSKKLIIEKTVTECLS